MLKEESRFAPSNVMEGMVSIRAVISSIDEGKSDRKIEKVLFDREKAKSHKGELGYLRAVSEKYGYEFCESCEEEISPLTTGNSHGGIIALCSGRSYPILKSEDIKKDGFYMLLEGIEDPYNFGYAIRSIYAAGVDGIILSPRNWLSASGVVCRASAGASERVDFYICDSESVVDIFHSAGYTVYCAEKENAVSIYETALARPLFIIVGGEKRGISKAISDKCDKKICLDYGRDFPQALSAASAASIIAFETYRQTGRAKS